MNEREVVREGVALCRGACRADLLSGDCHAK